MGFHVIVIAVIWLLAVSSFAQGIIHLLSAYQLHRQSSETRVGKSLTAREMSLGVKGPLRGVFDVLLAIAVTWAADVESWTFTRVMIILVALSSLVALYYGVHFIIVMYEEHWGQEDGPTRGDVAQINRKLDAIQSEARAAVKEAASEASRVHDGDTARQSTLLEVRTIVSHVDEEKP